MNSDNATVRLECLKAAEAAKKGGDPREILVIAEELLRWVKAGGGRRGLEPLAQPELSLELPELPFDPSGEPSGSEVKPPTIKQMVKLLLKERRPEGMTALQILAAIHKRWMPELVRTSLSPQLSRLKRDREIVQEHGVYCLNIEDAPSGEPGEASKK